jgi:hypothetical protein
LFVQLAYTVPSVEHAVSMWVERFAAGPFFLAEHIPLVDVTIRGAAATFDHTSAYGWLGNHMIELVQQNCATPSIFNEARFGLHHAACFVDDLDAALARYAALGMPTAMTAATANGTRFAFADATATLGHYIELYQDDPRIRSFYRQVERAASQWDGARPLRALGT